MTSSKRIAAALLIAGALLAGCDVSSPGGAVTPAPGTAPIPATTGAPEASPAGQGTAYPAPPEPTPTFAPGYVPPTPAQ